MTQINFYHVTSLPIGKVLSKLLEKVLQSDKRALVVANDDHRVEELNKELWLVNPQVFLPHGTKDDGYADQQPIYLTSDNDNPNNATIAVMVDNAKIGDLTNYEKCLYIFDGNNEQQLNKAREDWKELSKDHQVTYWQQDNKGAWQQAK